MQNIWILLADGAKAKCYQYHGPNTPLEKIKSFSHVNELSQNLVTTKRGRMPDPGQGQRSAMERPTDPHEHEKHVFARELSEWLEEQRQQFDRLILAASPNVLGDLRQLLSDKVKTKISDELDKDLTNIPEPELPKHLQPVLNIEEKPDSHLSSRLPHAKPI